LIELGIIITTSADPVETGGIDLVHVECQEVGQVKGALLSATAIVGVTIVNVDVLAIKCISINIVYRFLIVLSSSSSMLLAMAMVTTAAVMTNTVTAVVTATMTMMAMRTMTMVILRILHRRNYHNHHCHRHSQQAALK
jgi:hypothetical protein